MTWHELISAYKASTRQCRARGAGAAPTPTSHHHAAHNVTFKSGGLGDLAEPGGYQTWLCLDEHVCGDPAFCWVSGASKGFTPWGTSKRLHLDHLFRAAP